MMKILYPIIFLILLLGCSDVNETRPAEVDSSPIPDQESFNSTITISREGTRVAEIWARHILMYRAKAEFMLQDSIHVDFYDKKGTHNSVLTADQGIVYDQTKDLKALGNVVVVSDSGVTLLTEKLEWSNRRQRLFSDTLVTFITAEDSVFGDYFESDPGLKEYIIKNTSGVSTRKIKSKEIK